MVCSLLQVEAKQRELLAATNRAASLASEHEAAALATEKKERALEQSVEQLKAQLKQTQGLLTVVQQQRRAVQEDNAQLSAQLAAIESSQRSDTAQLTNQVRELRLQLDKLTTDHVRGGTGGRRQLCLRIALCIAEDVESAPEE